RRVRFMKTSGALCGVARARGTNGGGGQIAARTISSRRAGLVPRECIDCFAMMRKRNASGQTQGFQARIGAHAQFTAEARRARRLLPASRKINSPIIFERT